MKLQILIPFITILFSGCAFIPETAHIPLIKGKGDLRIDTGISAIPTANATISYGISDRAYYKQ